MIARGENGRVGMSSAPLVFGKFFDFSFAAHRLHYKPSSTHGSAWLPRNWKWWKTQKAWEWIHTIFQNAITRLLTICVARTDRLCGITHKLGNAQFGLNSASTKEQGIALSAPEERSYSRRQGRKHRINWRGPRGAPLTTLQLYTSAVGEHKMSYSGVVGCVCVCVWTGSRVYSVCAAHTGIQTQTLERRLWSQVTKKHTQLLPQKYFFFLQTNRQRHKYIKSVSLPSCRFELFLQHLFFISLQKTGAGACCGCSDATELKYKYIFTFSVWIVLSLVLSIVPDVALRSPWEEAQKKGSQFNSISGTSCLVMEPHWLHDSSASH